MFYGEFTGGYENGKGILIKVGEEDEKVVGQWAEGFMVDKLDLSDEEMAELMDEERFT